MLRRNLKHRSEPDDTDRKDQRNSSCWQWCPPHVAPRSVAAVCLQEAGYAAGEQMYESFRAWLPTFASVQDPAELDASALGDVLSAFFEELGWGQLTIAPAGRTALAITSPNWAEAEPGENVSLPSCYIASGLFADFMGRLSGTPVAVMEVECRSMNQPHCRFLVGAPETMEAVYDALASGSDYESALPA
jgi:predicted hydrocarbon binding protein